MARWDQVDDQTKDLLWEVGVGVTPFVVGAIGQGWENQMKKRSARFMSQRGGAGWGNILSKAKENPKLAARISNRMMETAALNVVERHGVFTEKTLSYALRRSAIRKQLLKIAFSRVANFSMKMFNVSLFAPMLAESAYSLTRKAHEYGIRGPRLELGGDYTDTRGAYTERQRALRAITSSRMSTRSALGNEAQLIHR